MEIKIIFTFLVIIPVILNVFTGCTTKSSNYHSTNKSNSFSDYIKHQEPELYDNIKSRYDSLK